MFFIHFTGFYIWFWDMFLAIENFGYIHHVSIVRVDIYYLQYLTQLYSNCPGRWIGRNIEKKGVRSYINRIRLKEFHNGSKIILKTYLQFQMKWPQMTKQTKLRSNLKLYSPRARLISIVCCFLEQLILSNLTVFL